MWATRGLGTALVRHHLKIILIPSECYLSLYNIRIWN